jgi:ATP-binding protein involved in chromosome partitioning
MSGKGGVGKSTTSVNLSLALAALGAKVALIDGDFYGPSIPVLMGGGVKGDEIQMNHEGQLIPPLKYGIKYISIAFFMSNQRDAVIWRGPMLSKALQQMFTDVAWGDVDYCIVDMPPGTGDSHLSLAQMQVIKIAGAVMVTTPQEVALSDVRRSISMLRKVNINIIGVIENMSSLTLPDGTKLDIFGSGGGAKLSEELEVPYLGSVPLMPEIRIGGDSGRPTYLDHEPTIKLFDKFAADVESFCREESIVSPLKVIN